MNELEQRMKTLEEKIKVLEETFETLKNMQLSEQMKGYIQAKTKAVHMIDLLNAVSDEPPIDFDDERIKLENMRDEKASVDCQIANALAETEISLKKGVDDTQDFNYEIENGTTSSVINSILAPFEGKGIRITGYKGASKQVIVPARINGYPVISIGANAFMNGTASKIILPSSLKVILSSAFGGCKKLIQIDLPNGLAYLGDQCFRDSGLVSIIIPDSVSSIEMSCFSRCKNLENVVIGNGVRRIGFFAFQDCSKLKHLSLPNGIEDIGNWAFFGTAIRTMIFPKSLKTLACDAFDHRIIYVFLGADTEISDSFLFRKLYGVKLIYCLPGSKIQSYARNHYIATKPLSEFKMEDYT